MKNKGKMPTKTDLLNGIIIDFKNGRDGKVVELDVDGIKKKLSQFELDSLINSLIAARQWLVK